MNGPILPPPPDLTAYSATPVAEGQSGGTVQRLTAAGRPTLYLKHGTGQVAADIVAETARLAWLHGRLPAPAIVHFAGTADTAVLLTTALPGRTAYSRLVDADPAQRLSLVEAIARFLKRLHDLPADDCPFHAGADHRLALARCNLEAGAVDAEDFDAARAGWTPQQVWDAMTALLPLEFGRVVTHGDFSLGNILVDDAGQVTGCIDVGRLGLADPWQDLAILWNNLAEFGDDLPGRLLAAYGTEPDRRKLEFHLCLDEFF